MFLSLENLSFFDQHFGPLLLGFSDEADVEEISDPVAAKTALSSSHSLVLFVPHDEDYAHACSSFIFMCHFFSLDRRWDTYTFVFLALP